MFLLLGTMVALFVVALLYDLRNKKIAQRFLPIAVSVGLIFFGISVSQGQDYSLFMMYQAAALIAALTGYTYLALKREPGSIHLASGVLTMIIAAIVQSTKAITFLPAIPFDHNSAYHIIQIVGVYFLTRGLLLSFEGTTHKQTFKKNRRIMVDMSATLIHHGHIRLLRQAAEIGSVIVGLTSDREIHQKKGYQPELSFSERKEILLAIKHVDAVVETPWLIDEQVLDLHQIDLLVHGDDNQNQISKNRLVILPRTKGISSQELRRRSLVSLGSIEDREGLNVT